AGAAPPRDHRRAGARLAHAAAVVLLAGLAGGRFAARREVTLRTGQEARIADPFGGVWRFESQGVSRSATPDHDLLAAALAASRDGAPRGLVVAEQLQYRDAQGDSVFAPVSRPGVRASPLLEMRARLLATDGDLVQLRITFVPLAPWIWIGGLGLVAAGIVALWPRAEPGESA
ncbi:MAG: hypothetical protein KGN74_11595, partial [Gemmatimonadota bacterium]|nr:hypothetical protein [Gemmatimonadota bacterium]